MFVHMLLCVCVEYLCSFFFANKETFKQQKQANPVYVYVYMCEYLCVCVCVVNFYSILIVSVQLLLLTKLNAKCLQKFIN